MTEEVTELSVEEQLAGAQAQIQQMNSVLIQKEFELQDLRGLVRELHAVAKTGSVRNGAWQHVRDRLLNAVK